MINNLENRTLLLGVGAQRSGTTWLSNFLKSLPEIFISEIKELHFFGGFYQNANWPASYFSKQLTSIDERQLIKPSSGATQITSRQLALRERLSMGDDVANYKNYFEGRILGERYFCEMTPAYCMLPVSEFLRIRDNFPRVKILFLMRNPADRFWSQVNFSKMKFPELTALEICKRQMNNVNFIRRSDYKSTLETIHSVFPKNDIHVEFFEHLFTRTAIQRLCQFLEVEFREPEFRKVRNASNSSAIQTQVRQFIVGVLKQQYRYVKDTFPNTYPDNWQEDITALEQSAPR